MADDEKTLPPEVRDYFRELGRRLGKEHGGKGGLTTNAKLSPAQRKRKASKAGTAARANETPEQRSERAKKAARARWGKKEN